MRCGFRVAVLFLFSTVLRLFWVGVVVCKRPKAAMIQHHPLRGDVVDRPRSGLFIASSFIGGCCMIAALAAIVPHLLIKEDSVYRPRKRPLYTTIYDKRVWYSSGLCRYDTYISY